MEENQVILLVLYAIGSGKSYAKIFLNQFRLKKNQANRSLGEKKQ